MSKGNAIVNLRVEDSLLERLKEEVAQHNEKSSDAVWTISDYVRKAVLEKIAHSDRGRKKAGKKLYPCIECGQMFETKKMAHMVKPLFGKREYTCQFCIRVTVAGI